MKRLKFKEGEKVKVKGKEHVIQVAQKNFSTKKISYLLDNGVKVAEEDIQKLSGEVEKKDTNPLFAKYKEVTGKDVPNNKKNDEAWIKGKIEAAEKEERLVGLRERYKEVTGNDVPEENTNDEEWITTEIEEATKDTIVFEALKELDFDGLKNVVAEKELEIDVADYEGAEDLLVAVCEELDIEIPNEDEE